MIKIDKKKIEVEGSKPRLLTEFSLIVRTLHETGIEKEDLERNFNMGFMDKEEIVDELLKTIAASFGTSESIEKIMKEVLMKED